MQVATSTAHSAALASEVLQLRNRFEWSWPASAKQELNPPTLITSLHWKRSCPLLQCVFIYTVCIYMYVYIGFRSLTYRMNTWTFLSLALYMYIYNINSTKQLLFSLPLPFLEESSLDQSATQHAALPEKPFPWGSGSEIVTLEVFLWRPWQTLPPQNHKLLHPILGSSVAEPKSSGCPEAPKPGQAKDDLNVHAFTRASIIHVCMNSIYIQAWHVYSLPRNKLVATCIGMLLNCLTKFTEKRPESLLHTPGKKRHLEPEE